MGTRHPKHWRALSPYLFFTRWRKKAKSCSVKILSIRAACERIRLLSAPSLLFIERWLTMATVNDWNSSSSSSPQIINFFLPVLFFRFTHHIIHTTHTRSDLPPLPAAAYPIWCKCLACYMVYFYFYILTISLLRTAVHRATSSAATE